LAALVGVQDERCFRLGSDHRDDRIRKLFEVSRADCVDLLFQAARDDLEVRRARLRDLAKFGKNDLVPCAVEMLVAKLGGDLVCPVTESDHPPKDRHFGVEV
jgi:hypothetical protein